MNSNIKTVLFLYVTSLQTKKFPSSIMKFKIFCPIVKTANSFL